MIIEYTVTVKLKARVNKRPSSSPFPGDTKPVDYLDFEYDESIEHVQLAFDKAAKEAIFKLPGTNPFMDELEFGGHRLVGVPNSAFLYIGGKRG